jgi:exopolysaccharide biosynthesis WecB/TagA/CpsF family protein
MQKNDAIKSAPSIGRPSDLSDRPSVLRTGDRAMTHAVPDIRFLSRQRNILGLPITCFTWTEAFSVLRVLAELPVGQTVIGFMNANNCNLAQQNNRYREAIKKQVILPDGLGIDVASFVQTGSFFPANLNGTDLVPAWLTYMNDPKRIGLIGAKPDILKDAARMFRLHTPWHEFIEIADGYDQKTRSGEILQSVAALNLDILIIAMGSPLQEIWIDTHVKPEHARLVLSVGALFDFMSGNVPRAPRWIRFLRQEWLFRLYLEPKRLWKRYLIGNPVFLSRVVISLFRKMASRISVMQTHQTAD